MLIIVSFLFWLSFVLVLWAYFGYPFLMFIWSRLFSQPVTQDDAYQPRMTLLIPAFNEADVIRRKVENSLSLHYPADKLQIIVVDDGSDDATPDIIREYESQGVTLITKPVRSGKMSSVNLGFERAEGEIVVLSDASPHYDAGALQLLARSFVDPSIGVVVGKLALWDAENAVAKSAGLYWRYEAMLRKWESQTGSTVAVHGNMFAIRRSAFRPLKESTINDEFSLAMETMRQGLRVIYEPEAISYDDASHSMTDEFSRRVRINAGRYQAMFSAGYLRAPTVNIAFRLFSHKMLRPLVPVLMLLMFGFNVIALGLADNDTSGFPFMLVAGWAALLLVGQVAFYSLAWLGYKVEGKGKRFLVLNVPYYFVSTNLAALLGLWRWLSGQQRVTWQKRTAGNED